MITPTINYPQYHQKWVVSLTLRFCLQDLVVCGLALCVVISRATPGVSQGGICTEEEKLRCHVSIILFHGFMQWESHEDHAFLSVGITSHAKTTRVGGEFRPCSKLVCCRIQQHLRAQPSGNLLAFRNKPICWRASVSSLWCFETILSILRCTPLIAIVALSWGCWHIFT